VKLQYGRSGRRSNAPPPTAPEALDKLLGGNLGRFMATSSAC
jgi:hypothetical protein